jgi:hypothetical protein
LTVTSTGRLRVESVSTYQIAEVPERTGFTPAADVVTALFGAPG